MYAYSMKIHLILHLQILNFQKEMIKEMSRLRAP